METTFNPVEMSSRFFDLTNLLLPAVTAAVGWLVGRRKQKNDFLAELQSSVNLLSEKNKEFVEEVVRLREENLMIRGEVIKLREENMTLRTEIETLNKNLVNFSSPPRPPLCPHPPTTLRIGEGR